MSDRFSIGSIVVIEELESSGAVEVYLGRQPALERDVMVRKLRRELLEEPALVDRFHREARFGAAVTHPNVVQVHDCFAYKGDHYLVMEWVDGLDLKTALERGEPVPPGVARRIAAAMALGLAELHAQAIVHGGVRPEHVLLSRLGELKLCGLGQARRVGEPDDPLPASADRYTAPEVVGGEVPGPAADVFALGSVLAELCEHAPTDRTGLRRRGLKAVARRCRAPELARRPSARELVGELELGVLDESPSDRRAELAAWLWESGILRPGPLRPAETDAAAPELSAPAAARRPRVPRLSELRIAAMGIAALGSAALGRALSHLPKRRPRRIVLRRLRQLSIPGIAVAMLAVGLVAYLASRPDAPDTPKGVPSVGAGPPQGPAYPALVGFVALPWAEVRVEGREPFLTPRAEPLELAAGSYEVVFEHPAYGVARRNVRVQAGEQTVVRHVFPEAATPQ